MDTNPAQTNMIDAGMLIEDDSGKLEVNPQYHPDPLPKQSETDRLWDLYDSQGVFDGHQISTMVKKETSTPEDSRLADKYGNLRKLAGQVSLEKFKEKQISDLNVEPGSPSEYIISERDHAAIAAHELAKEACKLCAFSGECGLNIEDQLYSMRKTRRDRFKKIIDDLAADRQDVPCRTIVKDTSKH